ncbi:hypothetical protein PIB30_083555 [Stylosanthes scabra]|uniref:Uncharacterized protein n=1 Tax=Stylosanthes scabra TaxID=79078 RepID=A0ABU6STQ1_9FABA|nr:hypothetical protein [Stylosanthes scabra]
MKEGEKLVLEEKTTQKRKGSNPSGVPLKSTSALEKLRTAESAKSVSGDSLNDVSSRSKESSNSNKTRKAIPDVERIEEPVILELDQSLYCLNRRIQIDPIIQLKEKLEETRAANVEKVKQSMKPLPSIPVIEIGAGDSDLDDLLQVISETKAGSELSNSNNKSVQQEKEDTPIQKARSESLKKVLLKSAAEKMIRLMNQSLDMLQKDPYWNNELVKVTSCLVEQQFPEKYRVQVSYFGKIFKNLFLTREELSDVHLKVAMIQENSNGLIIAKKALKEKDAFYEKHLANANDTLEELSRDKDALV